MAMNTLDPLFVEIAVDGTVVKYDPATTVVGPGLSDENLASYVADLAPWNAAILEQGITGPCAWRSAGVGVSYTHTLQDLNTPIGNQRNMVANMRAVGKEVQVLELDTGHCPHVTGLNEVVDIVDEIISGL